MPRARSPGSGTNPLCNERSLSSRRAVISITLPGVDGAANCGRLKGFQEGSDQYRGRIDAERATHVLPHNGSSPSYWLGLHAAIHQNLYFTSRDFGAGTNGVATEAGLVCIPIGCRDIPLEPAADRKQFRPDN